MRYAGGLVAGSLWLFGCSSARVVAVEPRVDAGAAPPATATLHDRDPRPIVAPEHADPPALRHRDPRPAEAPEPPEPPPGPNDKEAMRFYLLAVDAGFLVDEQAELRRALLKCREGCSARVLGRIHIALGTVAALMRGRWDEARRHFVTALRVDPGARLMDPILTTPELVTAFEAARQESARPAQP